MRVGVVSESSPRECAAAHPRLLPHQLATLRAMMEIEEGGECLAVDGGSVSTRQGVLGDKPGSGKSYVVAELAMDCGTTRSQGHDTIRVILSDTMSVSRVRRPELTHVDITLIVVPHNITRQWSDLLRTYETEDRGFYSVTKMTDVGVAGDILGAAAEEEPHHRVVLVSAAYYPLVVGAMRSKNVCCARAVFDEADSIRFSTPCSFAVARFYWFVTASVHNLFGSWSTGGAIAVCHAGGDVTTRVLWRTPRAASLYVRGFFPSHHPEWSQYISRTIVVTDNGFIDSSFALPPVVDNVVRCAKPVYTRVLDGLASEYIIERLAAGDIDSAVACMRPDRTDSEVNIISAAISHFETELSDAMAELDYARARSFSTQAMKDAAIARHEARVRECGNRISNVRERIVGARECMICYCEMTAKTVMPCCSNSFCLACITAWLAAALRPSCPVCKADACPSEFMVCHEGATERATREYYVGGVRMDEEDCKVKNLRALLGSLASGESSRDVRLLFFCDNDYAISNSGTKAMRDAGFDFVALKGNSAVINRRVHEFKNKPGPCALLVNCRFYGCGLNLESASDVVLFHSVDKATEDQIVGRAQRPPRSCPLRVWRFVEQ